MKIVYLQDQPEHRDTIATWLMQEWGARYPERTFDIWRDTQTYIGKNTLPLTLVAIDEETSAPIGTVCLRAEGMTTHPDWKGWLSYLLVPPSHRGKGIAKSLLKAAEDVAIVLNIGTLHLFTRLENPLLYIGAGWDVVGREEYRGGMVSTMKKNFREQHFRRGQLVWSHILQ
jgi:GNAT superfamily N-acetyltransferase